MATVANSNNNFSLITPFGELVNGKPKIPQWAKITLACLLWVASSAACGYAYMRLSQSTAANASALAALRSQVERAESIAESKAAESQAEIKRLSSEIEQICDGLEAADAARTELLNDLDGARTIRDVDRILNRTK
jgi:uncharacterized protein HemX